LYPLGTTVVVKDISTGEQSFLHGHNEKITCIAVSKSGKYVAAGQQTYQGFRVRLLLMNL
jgi:hypothetical protein